MRDIAYAATVGGVQKLEEDLHRNNQWGVHRWLQSLEPEKTQKVS